MNLYAGLMDEVNARLSWLSFALQGHSKLDPALVEEFGFLQLRMISELVALGCLVAHGDISEMKSERFQNEWSADRILNALEKLHPEFYPRPHKQERTVHNVSGVEVEGWHFADSDLDCIKKAELVSLYRRCGEQLHRGSLRKVTVAGSKPGAKWRVIDRHARRIANLLTFHTMPLTDDVQFGCIMRTPAEGGAYVFVSLPVDKVPGWAPDASH